MVRNLHLVSDRSQHRTNDDAARPDAGGIAAAATDRIADVDLTDRADRPPYAPTISPRYSFESSTSRSDHPTATNAVPARRHYAWLRGYV